MSPTVPKAFPVCHPASRQNNKGHPAYLGSGGHVANRRGSWLIGDNFHAAIIGPHDTNSSSNALRFLQIERVEPFSEPPVNRRKQFARLLRLPLLAPEACEAHGGAEFPVPAHASRSGACTL
jgi:hypothetical protein